MKQAIATRPFLRSDTNEHVKRGERIWGEPAYVSELERIGSVRDVKDLGEAPENKAVPKKAPGAASKSSASRAGPASQRTTQRKSKRGGRRAKTGE